MRKIVLLLGLALVTLCSCIGIDSRMTLKDDGSGTLALSYRVSHLVADLGVSASGSSDVPLPLTRADFDRSLASSKGKVRLASFSRSETDRDIVIKAQLAFDSFDALAKLDAFRDAHLTFSASGSGHSFSQLVARAPAQPPSDQTLKMYDALFADYTLTFVLQAPRPIQSTTLGTLSADRTTLTYTAPVRDIVTTMTDLVLTAGW